MAPDRPRRRIPDATVSRLPVYLGILGDQAQAGVANISSDGLAELAGVNAAKVRKDLSYLGSYGTRGVGYEVGYLVYQIRRELGLTHDWPVVIVGAGNLGQALAGYGGFGERGFPVVGIVDVDKSKVGAVLGGLRVRHIDELPQLVQSKRVNSDLCAKCIASGINIFATYGMEEPVEIQDAIKSCLTTDLKKLMEPSSETGGI